MSAIEHHFQAALPFSVRRQARQEVPDDVVARKSSLLDAIVLCVHTAPVESKVIAMELEIDQGQWSRIMSGQAHFPPNKLAKLMDICGNEIPLRWLALHRGYGLVRLRSEVERENELLRIQLEEQSKKLEHFREFMSFGKSA